MAENFNRDLCNLSLQRFQQNLDRVLEKYSQPYDDDDIVDLENFYISENKGSLKSRNPSTFGKSKLACSKPLAGDISAIASYDSAYFTTENEISMLLDKTQKIDQLSVTLPAELTDQTLVEDDILEETSDAETLATDSSSSSDWESEGDTNTERSSLPLSPQKNTSQVVSARESPDADGNNLRRSPRRQRTPRENGVYASQSPSPRNSMKTQKLNAPETAKSFNLELNCSSQRGSLELHRSPVKVQNKRQGTSNLGDAIFELCRKKGLNTRLKSPISTARHIYNVGSAMSPEVHKSPRWKPKGGARIIQADLLVAAESVQDDVLQDPVVAQKNKAAKKPARRIQASLVSRRNSVQVPTKDCHKSPVRNEPAVEVEDEHEAVAIVQERREIVELCSIESSEDDWERNSREKLTTVRSPCIQSPKQTHCSSRPPVANKHTPSHGLQEIFERMKTTSSSCKASQRSQHRASPSMKKVLDMNHAGAVEKMGGETAGVNTVEKGQPYCVLETDCIQATKPQVRNTKERIEHQSEKATVKLSSPGIKTRGASEISPKGIQHGIVEAGIASNEQAREIKEQKSSNQNLESVQSTTEMLETSETADERAQDAQDTMSDVYEFSTNETDSCAMFGDAENSTEDERDVTLSSEPRGTASDSSGQESCRDSKCRGGSAKHKGEKIMEINKKSIVTETELENRRKSRRQLKDSNSSLDEANEDTILPPGNKLTKIKEKNRDCGKSVSKKRIAQLDVRAAEGLHDEVLQRVEIPINRKCSIAKIPVNIRGTVPQSSVETMDVNGNLRAPTITPRSLSSNVLNTLSAPPKMLPSIVQSPSQLFAKLKLMSPAAAESRSTSTTSRSPRMETRSVGAKLVSSIESDTNTGTTKPVAIIGKKLRKATPVLKDMNAGKTNIVDDASDMISPFKIPELPGKYRKTPTSTCGTENLTTPDELPVVPKLLLGGNNSRKVKSRKQLDFQEDIMCSTPLKVQTDPLDISCLSSIQSDPSEISDDPLVGVSSSKTKEPKDLLAPLVAIPSEPDPHEAAGTPKSYKFFKNKTPGEKTKDNLYFKKDSLWKTPQKTPSRKFQTPKRALVVSQSMTLATSRNTILFDSEGSNSSDEDTSKVKLQNLLHFSPKASSTVLVGPDEKSGAVRLEPHRLVSPSRFIEKYSGRRSSSLTKRSPRRRPLQHRTQSVDRVAMLKTNNVTVSPKRTRPEYESNSDSEDMFLSPKVKRLEGQGRSRSLMKSCEELSDSDSTIIAGQTPSKSNNSSICFGPDNCNKTFCFKCMK